MATVSPENMSAIALALRFSGTRSAAIVEPIDIKTPCAREDTTRAIKRATMPVAVAANRLPAIKTSMIQRSSVLREMLDVRDVKIGAPKVTPRAYKVTVKPAAVIDI
ncbi:hypothetical protein D3C85_1392330 [compost metagenome]